MKVNGLKLRTLVALTVVALAVIAPQAAKAETWYGADGGIVSVRANCYSYGLNVAAVSYSGRPAYFQVWAKYRYPNGSTSNWELRTGWIPITSTQGIYNPVVNTNSRYVQLWVTVALWNGYQYVYPNPGIMQMGTTGLFECWT